MDAIESLHDGFLLLDSDDRLVMTNKRYLELYAPLAHLYVPGTPAEVPYTQTCPIVLGPANFCPSEKDQTTGFNTLPGWCVRRSVGVFEGRVNGKAGASIGFRVKGLE